MVEQGAQAAESLAHLARESEVIVLCLPKSANVEQALFGKSGLHEGLSPGKVVVDQTSGTPQDTKRIAARLAEMGVAMLDAPVGGGVPAAQAGRITIVLSGPDTAQDKAMPVFRAMTENIHRASGNVGDAQAVKTLNNMMNMGYRLAALELAAFGVRNGLPLAAVTQAMNEGPGASFSTRMHLPAVVEGRSSGDFALTLMLKDNTQAISLAADQGVPVPLSSLARGLLQQNINLVGPKAGLDDIPPFMAHVTGSDFAQPQGEGKPDELLPLISAGLAACNRAIVHELMGVAVKLGMQPAAFGSIINNSSAWSRACEDILSELDGTAAQPAQPLREAVATLQQIEERGTASGVPMLMTGQVRALWETALIAARPDARLDALIPWS